MDGETSYAVSKAGVIQLTKSTSYELGPYGINVNCVAPGPSPTNFIKVPDKEAVIEMLKKDIPLGRATTPGDIAVATAFFASDLSADISGQVLHVSGASVM